MNNCWMKNNCKQLHCNDVNGCMIIFKLNTLFDQALISDVERQNRELWIDRDGTDRDEFIQLKQIQDNIVNFINEGKNLYIHSNQSGNGKTSWALRLAQSYIKKIWRTANLTPKVLFISVPKFLIEMKSNITSYSEYYNHIKKYVEDCDLVIWDDIAHKVGTDYEISNLFSIIDRRLGRGKANIYTSNINPSDLGKLIDTRLASRVSNASINIELHGGDKRGLNYAIN